MKRYFEVLALEDGTWQVSAHRRVQFLIRPTVTDEGKSLVIVEDRRKHWLPSLTGEFIFRSVSAALAWCCDEAVRDDDTFFLD